MAHADALPKPNSAPTTSPVSDSIPTPANPSPAVAEDLNKPEEQKKSHGSLGKIIIIGLIVIVLGGVVYAASTCAIAIPVLSGLFGCNTETITTTTDQGLVPTTEESTTLDTTTTTGQ